MAFNTLYRVGSRSHALEFVHGRRGCDGNRAGLCQPWLDAGGWGLTGKEEPFIPNRNVYVCNNLLYNPAGFRSEFQHFNPSAGDFYLLPGGNVTAIGSFAIPDFGWSDAPARPPVPPGELRNLVANDRSCHPRPTHSPPGAYLP